MKLKKYVKRIAAFSLAVIMSVTALSSNSVVYADSDDYPEEILFPINVLDFRADNLLFEYKGNWEDNRVQGTYQIDFTLYDMWENNGGKGLVETELGPDGVPKYKKETVERIANYVQRALKVNLGTAIFDNNRNHYLSMRKYIIADRRGNYPLGDYNQSVQKFSDPNKGWTDITTCMDYAYFVTSNLFKYHSSLNTNATDYKQLIFHKVEDEDTGKVAYEFMADNAHKDTNLIYNKTNGTIRNAIGADQGDTTLGDEIKRGGSLFLVDDWERTYPDVDTLIRASDQGQDNQLHNFHYTVSSHAKFVYKADAGQYFYFSGDDDVYVYVNNKLLVDLGGAHQQLDGQFNLDQLARTNPELGLEDGKVVDLDFFYMERRSTASNFYAKMNFKLANDSVEHDLGYPTIPYGHLADLDYTFSSMRQLTTNKAVTFKDNFGNVIGAEDFILGEGVVLKDKKLSTKVTYGEDNSVTVGNDKGKASNESVFDFANNMITNTVTYVDGSVVTTQESLYAPPASNTIVNTVMDGSGGRYQTETYNFENNKITRRVVDKNGNTVETEEYTFDTATNKVTSVVKDSRGNVIETKETIFDFVNKRATTTSTAKDEDGNPLSPVVEALDHYSSTASMYDIFVAKIKVKNHFKNMELELGDTVDMVGPQFDTATKEYDDYDPSDDINLRQIRFAVDVYYDAWMDGATASTDGHVDTQNPVKVLVGSITVRTDTNGNMKSNLEDYGNFIVRRHSSLTDPGSVSYENESTENATKFGTGEFVANSDYTTSGVLSDLQINKLPLGYYVLSLDTSVLTGYTVTVNGKEVTADTIEFQPEYDPINQTWIYPDVEFILKATREAVKLKDLT